MKPFLYSAAIILAFTACRHQKAVTASTPPAAPAQITQTQPTQTSYTTVTSQGDVQIATDESTTATIEVTNPPDSVVTTVVAPNPQAIVDTTQIIYRLTISFISKGSGIDYKTEEDFEKWLQEQPKHPAYEKTHWGREGETNFCLKLEELSTREQEIFVKDVRTKLADKDLVLIAEYAPCKGHK